MGVTVLAHDSSRPAVRIGAHPIRGLLWGLALSSPFWAAVGAAFLHFVA
jgi:hypothetical protein